MNNSVAKFDIKSLGEYVKTDFEADIKNFKELSAVNSGFTNIDAISDFVPGLYLVGGESSVGKTTFTHQLCEQLAKSGIPILYFALEQAKIELACKSLARIQFQINPALANTANEIRHGVQSSLYEMSIDAFTEYADSLVVINGAFGITMDDIERITHEFIERHKKKPIIVVDYLQIIKPKNGMGVREAVSEHVQRIKALQLSLNTHMFVISSVNRSHYYMPIDFAAFKESGNIEYTADVVWGLQLSIVSDEAFQKEKEAVKPKLYSKEKSKYQRSVELVCLKERLGLSAYTCKFDYIPAHDTFIVRKEK